MRSRGRVPEKLLWNLRCDHDRGHLTLCCGAHFERRSSNCLRVSNHVAPIRTHVGRRRKTSGYWRFDKRSAPKTRTTRSEKFAAPASREATEKRLNHRGGELATISSSRDLVLRREPCWNLTHRSR